MGERNLVRIFYRVSGICALWEAGLRAPSPSGLVERARASLTSLSDDLSTFIHGEETITMDVGGLELEPAASVSARFVEPPDEEGLAGPVNVARLKRKRGN